MVVLNIKLSNFRLQATAPPTTLTQTTHLRVWSSTRRICGIESPPPNPTSVRHPTELVFPSSWSLSWTERLPDRLAQRAAVLNISAHCTPKSKLPFSAFSACAPRRPVHLGALRLDFFSLATGTVCHSLALRDQADQPTPYTLSFDIIVEQLTRITLTFADLHISHPPDLHPQSFSIEHLSGRRSQVSLTKSPDFEHQAITAAEFPPLALHSPNLRKLAHASLRLRLHGPDTILAQTTLPLHRLWSIIAHPNHPHHIHTDLSDDISCSCTISADRPPPTGQMSGGVTTDVGITGARPVVFGALLPDTPHAPQTSSLPPGWVTLVDTFGYRYYRNVAAAVDVWTKPSDETITSALQLDDSRALDQGYEKGKYGVYRNQVNGAATWIHPEASRLSSSSYTVPSSTASLPNPADVEFNSLSSFDLSANLHPATFTSVTRVAALEADGADTPSTDLKEPPRGRIVEMEWNQLPSHSYAPGVGTEGHTLTAVNGGKALLKFGGSLGSGNTRLNKLHSYDIEISRWREVRASGVLPVVRTGHGAVALGSDQSRLLIFGGSSPQGRRNDLHIFHVLSETWSPVSYTGAAPAVRARMGMTVTSDGSTALVFGGRSLYRYLGGKYYDPLFVNAFHAERSEWIQMRPQGTGPRPAPRSGCVMEFINNRHMLLYGGYDDGDRYFDDTFLFDMVSSSWQKIEQDDEHVPFARESHMSAMLEGNVLIYGGDSRRGLLNDLHVFDAGLMRWSERPNMVGLGPGKVCGGAMAAIGDSSLLLVGGDVGFKMSRAAYTLQVSRRSTIDAKSMTELVRERGPDADSCVVCLDAPVTTMFLWCGHSVCCRPCSKLVKGVCPVCRQAFSEVVQTAFDP